MELPDAGKSALLPIVILGLAVRIIFAIVQPRPLFSDQSDYYALGKGLAETCRYEKEGVPTAYRPAGYPVFLAGTFMVFGSNPLSVRILQTLFDIAVAVLLFLIASPSGRKTALLAAGLWAFYPPAILSCSLLMSETLSVFLIVAAAFLIIKGLESPRSWMLLSLGAVLGFLCLVKPWMILFSFASLALLRKIPLAKVGMVVATMSLVVLPWMIRNAVVMDSFSLSTNAGINLYVGNNPLATGAYSTELPDSLFTGTEAERNSRAFRTALAHITGNPAGFLLNGFRKLAHFFRSEGEILVWSFAPAPWNHDLRFSEQYRSLPMTHIVLVNAGYFLVLLLGILGIAASKPDTLFWFCTILLISMLVIHMTFFGGSRFHFPLMPFMALYAAQAVSRSIRESLRAAPTWRRVCFVTASALLLSLWTYEFIAVF